MQLQCREKYIYENPGSTYTLPPTDFQVSFQACFRPLALEKYIARFGVLPVRYFHRLSQSQHIGFGARICKRLPKNQFNSEESIPPAYVAWRAGTKKGLSYWPASWESIPGLHKRSTNTGSGQFNKLMNKCDGIGPWISLCIFFSRYGSSFLEIQVQETKNSDCDSRKVASAVACLWILHLNVTHFLYSSCHTECYQFHFSVKLKYFVLYIYEYVRTLAKTWHLCVHHICSVFSLLNPGKKLN